MDFAGVNGSVGRRSADERLLASHRILQPMFSGQASAAYELPLDVAMLHRH